MSAAAAPPAAVMVIATVLEVHGYAKPGRMAQLIAGALREAGWQVSAPTGRVAGAVVDGPSNGPPTT